MMLACATNRVSSLRRMLILFLTIYGNGALGLTVLSGTPDTPSTQTFNFFIQAHKQSIINHNFYVGALAANTGNDFSVAYIPRNNNQFVALAPEQVRFNAQAVQANPLFNAGIAFMDILATEGFASLEDRLAVVTTNSPTKVYVISNIHVPANLLVAGTDPLNDANGAVTSGIVSIASTAGGASGIFAAVKPNGGNFGASGSGIALVSTIQVTADNIKQLRIGQINAQAGGLTTVRAAPLDTTSTVLAIGGNLASITNVIDMTWHAPLQRLYIALQVTAGAGVANGARALAVARVGKDGQIIFENFAPDAVFQNTLGIAGTFGANTQQSLYKVRTFRSSTGLDFVVVLGGNGAPGSNQNTVYALPLVNAINSDRVVTNEDIQGTLASKNAAPQDLFASGTYQVSIGRALPTPATTASDTYTTTHTLANAPALVGGGALATGNIDDLFITGDTVFAVVGTAADATQVPGIFYSQALFNDLGQLQTWSSWQRVAGTAQAIFGASFDPTLGNFNLMTGADINSINTVQRTTWGTGDAQELQPLNTLLGEQFALAQGGIQALFDIPRNTPGMRDISALIATGNATIALIQTGLTSASGAFIPTGGTGLATGFGAGKQTFPTGTITAHPETRFIAISGGALNAVGPITSAEITAVASTSTIPQGYLFVGGTHGVAVLSNPNGTGWNGVTGLTDNFQGLTTGMTFQLVGNYSFVRKIVADGTFVYILTDHQLDRIDLSTGQLAPNFIPTTVAESKSLGGVGAHGALLDVVVSGKFAVLATDNGLFRVGNDADISVALTPDHVAWTPMAVPEQVGPPRKLIALSATGRPQDIATGSGGNLYVLDAYQFIAVANRYNIAPADTSSITNSTMLPFRDIRVKNILSYYIGFGGYANNFITDGALKLHSRDRNLLQSPFVQSGTTTPTFVELPLKIENASTIVRLLRSSASGSWLIAGDFGLQINE